MQTNDVMQLDKERDSTFWY